MKSASPLLSRLILTGWGAANLVGMLVFLRWSASCCWIEPELKDVPVASGGAAFVWGFGPFLIFTAFVIANFAWVTVVEMRGPRDRSWSALAAPFLVLLGWSAAFIFDGVHH